MSTQLKRVPPQSREAEESILGGMMIARSVIERVTEIVHPDDFYFGSHATIFKAAQRLDAAGSPVDGITLTAELERSGELESIGGRSKIAELAALVPTAANAEHYARLVRDSADLRRLIKAGGHISDLGWDGGDVDELHARAEEILSAAVTRADAGEFVQLSADLDDLLAELRESYQTKTPITGTATGFTDIDKLTTGFYPGQLVIVAARPSMGKSAWGQNIAENIADRGGVAAIFSLEMSRAEIIKRSLARHARVDVKHPHEWSREEAMRVRLAEGVLRNRRLYVEEDSSLTPAELRARARRLQRASGLDLLVVDYLQLMVTNHKEDNDQARVAYISRQLKLLARELNIPVIACAQLNRGVENRQEKRPNLSDLRDSGAIEQDADVVCFLYRDEYYNPESESKGVAEVIVAKNRNGDVGTTKLAFVRKHTTFKNLGGEM